MSFSIICIYLFRVKSLLYGRCQAGITQQIQLFLKALSKEQDQKLKTFPTLRVWMRVCLSVLALLQVGNQSSV